MALRYRHDPQDRLRDYPECALRADRRAHEVIAGPVGLAAPERHQGAVAEDELEAADVVGREAVLEAVRTAGVLGDVAADRADDLTRGVGREVVPGPTAAETSTFVTPGSTTTRPLGRSTASTRFILVSAMRMPSASGSAPPESPEPAPRATNGTPASKHARTTRATSAAEAGSTTAPGVTA